MELSLKKLTSKDNKPGGTENKYKPNWSMLLRNPISVLPSLSTTSNFSAILKNNICSFC